MSQYTANGPINTHVAGSAIVAFRFVHPIGGGNNKLEHAGATHSDIVGTSASAASGDTIPFGVFPLQSGKHQVTAGGVITAGNKIYCTATGKALATGTHVVGVADTGAAQDGDVIVFTPIGNPACDLTFADFTEQALAAIDVPILTGRIHDAAMSPAATTATSDDAAVIVGTFGSASPTIQTSDAKAATVTQKIRYNVALGRNYIDGEGIKIRLRAAMLTTVSDTTATVDINAYVSDGVGGISADLCETAAQSINSLTPANLDFVITPTSRVRGETIDFVITIAITDGATATVVTGSVSRIQLLADSSL